MNKFRKIVTIIIFIISLDLLEKVLIKILPLYDTIANIIYIEASIYCILQVLIALIYLMDVLSRISCNKEI